MRDKRPVHALLKDEAHDFQRVGSHLNVFSVHHKIEKRVEETHVLHKDLLCVSEPDYGHKGSHSQLGKLLGVLK